MLSGKSPWDRFLSKLSRKGKEKAIFSPRNPAESRQAEVGPLTTPQSTKERESSSNEVRSNSKQSINPISNSLISQENFGLFEFPNQLGRALLSTSRPAVR